MQTAKQSNAASATRAAIIGLTRRLGPTSSRTGTAGGDSYTLDNVRGSLNQHSSRTNNYAHAAGTVGAATGTTVGVADGSGNWPVGRLGRYWAAQLGQSNVVPTYANVTVTANSASGVETGARAMLLSPLTQSFTYDADGNLTDDGVWAYSYDAENRLVAIEIPQPRIGSVQAANARRLEFQYDYLGRRVQKRILGWNGSQYLNVLSQRRYLYEGDNLIAELTGEGVTVLKSFTWALDLGGSLEATAGVGGLVRIADHITNTSYFPSYDSNGNVAALLRATDGEAVAKYEYSPFGELLRCEGTYAKSNPFRFSTKFYDEEIGLVYYGLRYYSPSLGRFITRDPIEEKGGLNLYAFCGNDAVNGIDYKGMLTVTFTTNASAPADGIVVLPPFHVPDTKLPSGGQFHFGDEVDAGSSSSRRWYIGQGQRSNDGRTRPPTDASITEILKTPAVQLEAFYVRERAPNNGATADLARLDGIEQTRIEAFFGSLANQRAAARTGLVISGLEIVRDVSLTTGGGFFAGLGASAAAARSAATARGMYSAATSWQEVNALAQVAAQAQTQANLLRNGAALTVAIGYNLAMADGFAEAGIKTGAEAMDFMGNTRGALGVLIDLNEATRDYIRTSGLSDDQAAAVVLSIRASVDQTRQTVINRYSTGP